MGSTFQLKNPLKMNTLVQVRKIWNLLIQIVQNSFFCVITFDRKTKTGREINFFFW